MLLALALSGCAADMALRDSESLRRAGDVDGALARVAAAQKAVPDDVRLKMEYRRLIDLYTIQQVREADVALAAGDSRGALDRLKALQARDPGNFRAEQAIRQVEARTRYQVWLYEAQQMAAKNPEAALDKVKMIIAEEPGFPGARAFRDELIRRTGSADTLMPQLSETLRKPLALSFFNQGITTIFDVVSRMTGVNFIFDREVPPGLTATVYTARSTAEDVINLVLSTNQLRKKVLNDNTLLIYPARADKDREYQDLAVRTYYLSNADPKAVVGTVKQILKPRDAVVDERLNALVLRDTPQLLAAADKLVQALDLPQSEVTLDVEVLEVNRSTLREIGVGYPGAVGFSPLAGGGRLTVGSLKDLDGNGIGVDLGVPALKLNLLHQSADTRTLANPKIRVKNREKATIKIGDKVPVVTTTNANGVVSETVQYQEVGLTLKVEPSITLDNEISVKVALEVSDITEKQETKTGLIVYKLGSRSADTILSARNNETQVLAGLIKKSEMAGRTGLPFLSQVPILDSLFGSRRVDTVENEIILLITPRIDRKLELPPSALSSFIAGPEARTGETLTLRNTGDSLTMQNGDGSGGMPPFVPGPGAPPPPPPGPASLTLPPPVGSANPDHAAQYGRGGK
ncbi:general secretion pathway protein GspD [Crenobacter cavernae]|uniref:General secretion pathway protein GspD n=1 Tax=Crenobacter cavernae TaxID=2290923 RepID=A0ABY0FBF9_9NEIS|nr:general secretion pathway protein GspD [Crenobacter cavernae]